MRVPSLAGFNCNHGPHRHFGPYGARCSACGASWCTLAAYDCELCHRRPRRWSAVRPLGHDLDALWRLERAEARRMGAGA